MRHLMSLLTIAVMVLTTTSAAAAPGNTTRPVPDGAVIWHDLLTEDAETAISFYTELFGWTFRPFEEGAWVALHRGQPVAGISQIEDRQIGQNEAFWLASLAIGDVDGALEQARALGSKVHVEATEVDGFGHYGVIQDPQGAPVMLLDPEPGLTSARGLGAWVWDELWCDDAGSAASFYREVIGFEKSEVEIGGQPYSMLSTGGKPRAGLVTIPDSYTDVTPAWAPYIGVRNAETTINQAKKLGAEILIGSTPDFAGGRIALIADPTGGAFFVFEMDAEVAR